MSSTNKTTNYNLSQYIGSDKPTYLTDYNGDMLKIDTQMKVNADNVALAISGVETATTTANTANSTATTANTNANTANTNANKALTDLNAFKQKFNLTNTINYGSGDISFVSGSGYISLSNITECAITIAKDSTGSIFKLYGSLIATAPSAGTVRIELDNTGLLTDESYVIYPSGTAFVQGSNALPGRARYLIENNKIYIQWYNSGAGTVNLMLMPCVYFNANFGDNPQNQ